MHQKYNIDELNEKYNALKAEREKYNGTDINELTMLYEKEVNVLEEIRDAYKVTIRSKLDELKELNNNRK